MKKFRFPKFKKGQKVKTPDGIGTVKEVKWMDGKNWYNVKDSFYSEIELFEA